MKKELINKDDIPNILVELQEAFFDIPFGNSSFQNENFVINAAHTPERAYRAIGLRLFDRIRALKESQYERLKSDIDIEEMREKISDPSTDKYAKRRLELDIAKKLDDRNYVDKLINDALTEVSCLYSAYKKLPRYSREQFEAGERAHFTIRLQKQARGITGALESLDNMGELVIENKKTPPLLSNIGITTDALESQL